MSEIKTVHLPGINRFFYKNKAGTLTRKRISATLDKQFPRKYRDIYQASDIIQLVRFVREEQQLDCTNAWLFVRKMINE